MLKDNSDEIARIYNKYKLMKVTKDLKVSITHDLILYADMSMTEASKLFHIWTNHDKMQFNQELN